MKAQINQVSDTAFMAAAYRARETNHPNAIFHDPLAAKLAGDHGKMIIDNLPKQAFVGGWSVVIRTRIIDDFIQGAIAEGVDTVLNLGAGLDTRPYRMELPDSLRWIEVDYPHVIELKESRLAGETPRCRLERVRLDLADVDARQTLLDEVATRSGKVLVLTEAVTPYLSEEAVASLGEDLGARESIWYWVVDYFSPASYEYRRRSGMSKSMENAPFLFEPKDYLGFFLRIGWKPKETRYFAIEGERLRRPAPFPLITRLVMRILAFAASAERRREMKRYAGFVLFESADT
ncbi:class I SAM-dependent methyltransferase [Niveibacterium umoris]|uniref:S-adenosyl-L-methionine-dependent methyltransferase n=1 Tax=Niveibacterium umoris TaxID=1193620 RepID=A0A840BER5_9RHOO|nr:SAM-dependent methyltransferase [Niveibacterium umoris]MBB4012021.1 methyltransferase (TIGR00027 family) [Niveibacterium umoris]